MLPPTPWRVGPQPSQRPCRPRWSSAARICPMSTTSKARWCRWRVALVDQRHHVVVGVDVEPDAVLAEPVGHGHAEHARVEVDLLRHRAREEVHVAELARGADVPVAGRPRVRRPRRRGLAVRQQQHAVALGIAHEHAAVALLPGHAAGVEMRAGGVERAGAAQLVGDVRARRAPAPGSTARRRTRAARRRGRPARTAPPSAPTPPRRRRCRSRTWSIRRSAITAPPARAAA